MPHLSYIISFACLLFAVHLLKTRPVNRAPSVLLGTIFLVFVGQSALLVLLLVNEGPHWATSVRPAMAMTIGPLVWLYFTSAANPSFHFRILHGLHFLPALFIAFELATNTYIIGIDYAILASFAVYAIAVCIKASRGVAQFTHLGEAKHIAYRWLVAGAALLAASFIGETTIYIDIIHGGSLTQSFPLLIALLVDLLIATIVLFVALQRPSPFDWMYTFGKLLGDRTAHSLTDEEYTACISAFERLVETEKLFAEEGMTLSAATKRLGIPARKLSEAINRAYQESYSRHMNRLRVDEAKRLSSCFHCPGDPDRPRH